MGGLAFQKRNDPQMFDVPPPIHRNLYVLGEGAVLLDMASGKNSPHHCAVFQVLPGILSRVNV